MKRNSAIFPVALVETGHQLNEVQDFPVYERNGAVNIHTISLLGLEINTLRVYRTDFKAPQACPYSRNEN